jgi:hypothetical protein
MAGKLFIDLTDIFGGIEDDVYTDYCHLTPVGNKRLAEYLGAKLLPVVGKHINGHQANPSSMTPDGGHDVKAAVRG